MADTSASSLPTWIPAMTALGGVVVGLMSPWFTSLYTSKREREGRREARHDAAIQKQNDFQRETLLTLQDLALRLMTLAVDLEFHARKEQLQQNFIYEYPEILTKDSGDAYFGALRLSVRILDEETRKSADRLVRAFGDVFKASDKDTLDVSVRHFRESYYRFVDASGERLRTLEHKLLADE